jgi:flagellar P-ring protein precursor FlgI
MKTTASKMSRVLVLFLVAWIAVTGSQVSARTQLKNICRLKGQETNVLRGLGLVVGLNGTGAANDPVTMRALARAMEVMHNPVAGGSQQGALEELKKIQNVAMVMVMATVPATGSRRGDLIDCYVSALNGKSLVGGRLAFASLQGPNTQDTRVYALCEGQVMVDDPNVPTSGVVQAGCQLEVDIFTPFHRDGYMTLILDNNHANFQTAAMIAEEIDRKYRESLDYSTDENNASQETVSRAIDAANILVRIPEVYRNDPVAFASDVLDIKLYEHEPEARVVVNPRAGSIVISGEVEIGDVVVSHKNIIVETVAIDRFSAIDTELTNEPKLKTMIDQLNALQVPTEDMIDIIRGINQNGKLHGRLVIE